MYLHKYTPGLFNDFYVLLFACQLPVSPRDRALGWRGEPAATSDTLVQPIGAEYYC